jgi:hypothetical protein
MSRTLSGGVEVNIEDDVIYPFFAVELLFDDGTFDGADGNIYDRILRLWTGFGTLVYNGNSYFGTGNLLDISAVEETVEMAARGATLTLSGVPSDVLSLALSEQYQGRQARIYFGLFQKGRLERQSSTDENQDFILLQDGGKIILERNETSLTEIFTGYMDQMNIEEGPQSSRVELRIENKLIDLERPRVGRFTSEYQKSVYPDDKGFDFVESMQDLQLNWGRKNA